MAISIIYGPGGAGKSMWQMHCIVHELRNSKRNIVTNMSLNVPQFHEYLERKYPKESINLLDRLRLLDAAESGEFWKHRGPVKWVGPGEYDYAVDVGLYGVAFVIDEAGACGFSAIAYAAKTARATRGEEFGWYLDQQRKFSDNVYMSTNGRMPHGIAKPVRDKAHEFTRLKNGALSSYGMFRGIPKFYRYHYAVEPDKTTEPFQQGTFEMDFEGLGSCYRTQDGIGIVGHDADKGARAKGLPIWVMVPAVMALGLLCVAIPYYGGRGVSRWISGGTEAKIKKLTDGTPLAAPAAHDSPKPKPKTDYPGIERPPGQKADTPQKAVADLDDFVSRHVYAVGWAMKGNRINVLLSDGTIVTEAGGELQSKPPYPGYVWISGRKVPFKPLPRPQTAPVAAVPYKFPGAWQEPAQDGQSGGAETVEVESPTADITPHGGDRSVSSEKQPSKKEVVRHDKPTSTQKVRGSAGGTLAVTSKKGR